MGCSNQLIEFREPNLQHAVKLLFFCLHDLGHANSRVNQLWISPLHQIPHSIDHLEEKRLLLPQQSPMPNPAPQNLPQHVAPTFVRRKNSVTYQECCGTCVIGDYAQRSILYRILWNTDTYVCG
jgi:hypothetical protein